MSAFEWNKVIGAILVALLVIKVADISGNALLHAKVPAKHAYPVAGIAPAKPGAATAMKKPVQLAAIGPMLAKASAAEGAKSARKCAVCHSFTKGGANKVGPALWGVVGKDIASAKFTYSSAFKGLKGKWDYETLNKFLANPRGFAPGTKMAFAGLKKDAERAGVIAYLRAQADNPAPLP
ncbi:MAG: cytochrome c [Alphaproteobacteria bacterium]|jgi:cytochrome c